jgi:C4-dicarboxylate-binding protein DctP
MTETTHGVIDYMVVANTKFWSGLPKDVRDVLEKSMNEATEHVNKTSEEFNAADRKKIVDSGRSEIITLSKQQQAAWRKAMEPVYKKFENEIGKDLIDAALKSNKAS